MTEGKPYKRGKGGLSENWGYFQTFDNRKNESGKRNPTTVLSFHRERGYHPTQKPVPLLEWLIKTYTNPGETVLDNCMGSGSTGVACVNTGRDFIGMELDKNYYDIAVKRIEEAKAIKENKDE